MPRHLVVRHTTEYRYAEPVAFGRHRMMLRPRDSHSLRLLDTRLLITPEPTRIRWVYDVFGNSVSYAEFDDAKSDTLRFESEIELLHYESPQPTALILPSAVSYPFAYDPDEVPDLLPMMVLHRPDPDGRLVAWANGFASGADAETLPILNAIVDCIRGEFRYQRRSASGTQDPVTTLDLRTGTCRDFALLMIEALRALGFAARFVSGYIYNPRRGTRQGGGATHAWVQVYLPGAGWIEIDPTNGIFGNRDLIRVAVARDHKQASPLSGSFVGPRSAYRGMVVDVAVSNADELTGASSAAG